ncbi:hypothetical protein ANCCAN_09079 [Ancylostoma caninum]|uniref:Uncharacterized protein n=1 Tax=Ancylostoma caninum TaxID=29170 RepID=A0A368GKI2_ANCCA|nr:hypothetical protein ANCCAN_09079 [Ancylostoma caninum]
MSSGPSRARVMEMERLVNSIFPRKTRGNGPADSAEDVRPIVIPAEALIEPSQPCFCPVFSPCVDTGNCPRCCHRISAFMILHKYRIKLGGYSDE